MQLLVRLPKKFLRMICNLGTKTFKIRIVTFIFSKLKKIQKRKKNEKILMDPEKSINLFEMKLIIIKQHIFSTSLIWLIFFKFLLR